MVFVVGLPRLRAHVAERFAARAGHEVAPHRPLDCLLAPRAHLRVCRYPLRVRLLRQHLLLPLLFLLAFARIVVVALAAEAEHLPAHALHRVNRQFVNFDAVSAIGPSAKLVVSVRGDE